MNATGDIGLNASYGLGNNFLVYADGLKISSFIRANHIRT